MLTNLEMSEGSYATDLPGPESKLEMFSREVDIQIPQHITEFMEYIHSGQGSKLGRGIS